MIKTAKELVAACLDAANNHKTLYVMGCFGAPLNESSKARYIKHHSYNQKPERKAMIQAASADCFGFDCICLVKGLLWNWNGDTSKTYGGAGYAINGVPDIGTEQMIAVCKDVSTDFAKIQPGEFLWMQGHCGIYIGNGQAVECTPAWENGVQVTTVRNIKSGTGHMWTTHGKLPYVEYTGESEVKPVAPAVAGNAISMRTLSQGARGEDVRALQILLSGRGCNGEMHEPDGIFGPNTLGAVKLYQKKAGLEVDGIVGKLTWSSLLGV